MEMHICLRPALLSCRCATARRATAFVVCLLLLPAALPGAGREFGLRGHDLNIVVDTRWAGNMQGGYYPVRIRVVNTGPSCELTFRFVPDGEGLPEVRRGAIVADQNATLQLSLPVPMVGSGSSGRLEVEKDGELLRDFTQRISLAESYARTLPRPSLLIVSPVGVDAGQFELAVSLSATAYHGHISVGQDHQQIPPGMVPRSWVEYSGVDLVAIPLATLAAIGAEPRSALIAWVRCGGTLLVYDVGEAAQPAELPRLLELPPEPPVASEWHPADPAEREAATSQLSSLPLHQGSVLGLAPEEALRMLARNPERLAERFAEAVGNAGAMTGAGGVSTWPRDAQAFAYRDLMFGRVYTFPENPFPGSAWDWQWLLQSVGAPRLLWMTRHGSSPRTSSHEFLDFTIPDLQSIPVYAFLILISLFALVIGPVNYIWLWKRKQTWLLVLTIPLLAFATSATLFAYSTLAHGFSIKSRARSLTLLDQKSNTAVTTSRVALFAGLSPSGGLTFSPETAVYPVWPAGQGFRNGLVDWSQTQMLQSGWLHSRTRTHFLTISHRDERGRIEVGPPAADGLDISNGLEWEIESLILAAEDGMLYYGTRIPAGATARLSRATSEDLRALAEQLRRDPLEPPPDLVDPRRAQGGLWTRSPQVYTSSLAESRMEQTIQRLQRIASGDVLEPNSYLALLAEPPAIELGVEKTDSRGEFHLLLGEY